MKKLIIFCTLCLNLSCASIHKGNPAQAKNQLNPINLKLSAESLETNADEPFQLIEITFENLSNNWIKIYRSELIFDNTTQADVSVVQGSDLRDWAQAVKAQNKIYNYKKKLTQAGMLAAGSLTALAGASSNDRKLKELGIISAVSVTAWVISDILRSLFFVSEGGAQNPENHLYQPFAVPGKLFMRRWVLLNKPVNTEIKKLNLKLETVEGEKEDYELPL